MKYIEKESQKQRILNLLTERGSAGVYVYEMTNSRPNGLGVSQYNARINGLRKKGHNIINTQPGHFVLSKDKVVPPTYLKPSTVTTQPQKPQYQYIPEPREDLIRVEKLINGVPRVFWERPEDLRPVQKNLAL